MERLEVEKAFHPFIAGPYNRLVSEIMQETGTRINIPPPSVNRTEIVFTGEKEQLAQAVARIRKIYEEKVGRAAAPRCRPGPAGVWGAPAGRGLGAFSLPQRSPPLARRRRFSRAPSEAAARPAGAAQRPRAAPALAALPPTPGRSPQKKKTTTIAVEVKKSQHKYVIGPKGNSLQEILERTGVSVEIPPSDSASETVILRGEPEKLGQALTEVYAKVTAPCGVGLLAGTSRTWSRGRVGGRERSPSGALTAPWRGVHEPVVSRCS